MARRFPRGLNSRRAGSLDRSQLAAVGTEGLYILSLFADAAAPAAGARFVDNPAPCADNRRAMITLLKEIAGRRELLLMLVQRNLKIRYKSSALGFLWSLLVPVFMILIYSIFLSVLKIPIDIRELVTGIMVWQFLALCLGDSLHAVVGNANLVTKAAFPRIILPLGMVISNLVNFLLSFLVLVLFLIVWGLLYGGSVGPVYWLPAVLLTQVALCVGVSLILAAANVFFRDTEHILSMLMLAWFFLTPVIYPIGFVLDSPRFPYWVHTLFFCNPMTGIVTGFRVSLLGGGAPAAIHMALSAAAAWAMAVRW